MMEAVHRYESTVNQVMGDGIMALFGAPVAHEDHAVRACYAALQMQDTVRRYSGELRRSQGIEVYIRVGLHSGGVVVRSIGSRTGTAPRRARTRRTPGTPETRAQRTAAGSRRRRPPPPRPGRSPDAR